MMAVEVSTQPKLTLSKPRKLFEGKPNGIEMRPIRRYDVSDDGQRFVVVRALAGERKLPRIAVVQNWATELSE